MTRLMNSVGFVYKSTREQISILIPETAAGRKTRPSTSNIHVLLRFFHQIIKVLHQQPSENDQLNITYMLCLKRTNQINQRHVTKKTFVLHRLFSFCPLFPSFHPLRCYMQLRFSEELISLKIPSLEKSSDNNIPGKKSFPSDGLQPINGDRLACVAVGLQIIGQKRARLAFEIGSGVSRAQV